MLHEENLRELDNGYEAPVSHIIQDPPLGGGHQVCDLISAHAAGVVQHQGKIGLHLLHHQHLGGHVMVRGQRPEADRSRQTFETFETYEGFCYTLDIKNYLYSIQRIYLLRQPM